MRNAREKGKISGVAAVAAGFGVRQKRPRQELYDYMHALAAARREKGDAESRHMSDTIEHYELRDDIAEALGIDVGAEDWWDSNDQTKREKIMGRISVLRDLRSKSTPNIGSQTQPPTTNQL